MKALLPLLLFSTLANSQAPTGGGAAVDSITFSGHITRADDGKPIEGATVILAPCVGCDGAFSKLPAHVPVTTTAADGSYRFTNISKRFEWIQAAHTGFVPALAGCNACAGEAISVDLKMAPAAIPAQMNDRALTTAYGDKRLYVEFRAAAFTADGNSLQLLTFNGDHGGPEMGWKYDLKADTLAAGPMITDEESDTQTVGEYSVTMGPSCRGCGGSIVVQNLKTGRGYRLTDSAESVVAASSDGKAIFWYDGRGMEAFDLDTHRATHISSLPSSSGFEPLAARPEVDGYLLAYEVVGSCNIDGAALIRQVESDQAEQVAQKDASARAPKPHNVCFLHVRMPTR